MNLENHLKFSKMLICVRNVLFKFKKIDTRQILFESLQSCFDIKENKLKEALWYFMMSENMQHWVIIDTLKKHEITKERISAFSNNIMDYIYNESSLTDKQKDFLSNKIKKYIKQFFN